MLVITIDERKQKVERHFKTLHDLKKFLKHRGLFIRPKGKQTLKGVDYKSFRVGSYLKDTTPRFETLLVLE